MNIENFLSFEKEITSFRGEYSWLSNFHKCDCLYNNKIYPSSEHVYLAHKSTNENDHELIRGHPFDGLKSTSRKIELRNDWNEVKLEIMQIALFVKFSQHEYLKQKLLSTGNAIIIEKNSWHDNFYGDCSCPKCSKIIGQNHLGILLMDLRKYFKKRNGL